MSTMASQITSLTIVYSTVYSDADQRKHQSSASLAFGDRWIPRTNGQLRGKCPIWWCHHVSLILSRTYVLRSTWSETYFRQDLFPSYLFFRRQFHAIVIFRLKSISDQDSGSLPRFFGEFIYAKLSIMVSYYNMTVWILVGNYISFTIAAGLIRLHMPGVKKSRV